MKNFQWKNQGRKLENFELCLFPRNSTDAERSFGLVKPDLDVSLKVRNFTILAVCIFNRSTPL